MLPFQLLRQAERELDLARKWYDEQRHGLGLVFFDAYEDAVQHAQQFPDAGFVVSNTELSRTVRRFPLRGFPFHLVTSVVDDTLVVIAVAHAKRKPGYWLERIR
ncbi:MAG: type II toxin-antitoxin system RelE/ParE family toxin [Deltaproteobacteria bacterium]|nr:type II toxin-antitoxin system RelE/ParE family toxin [Deltaproteobacteria bacterium]